MGKSCHTITPEFVAGVVELLGFQQSAAPDAEQLDPGRLRGADQPAGSARAAGRAGYRRASSSCPLTKSGRPLTTNCQSAQRSAVRGPGVGRIRMVRMP